MGSITQLWDKLRGLEQLDFERAIIVMRHLWLRRNKFVYNGKLLPPNQLTLMTMQVYELFQLAHEKSLDSIVKVVTTLCS